MPKNIEENKQNKNEFKKLFKKELRQIKNTIDEIDELYNESKEFLDNIKRSTGARGTLSFVHLQTANLINLRNSKLNALRDKVNLKKIVSELNIKNKALDSNVDLGDDSSIHKLFNLIINNENGHDGKVKNKNNEEDYTEENDDKLEKKIKKLHKEGKMDIVYELCVELNNNKWKFVAIDVDGNIYYKPYKNIEFPSSPEYYKMKKKKINGKMYCIDQFGNKYKIYKRK